MSSATESATPAASSATPRPLVIKCTAGVEAPEKVNQAFNVAAIAAASGSHVSLWLTGEAVWLAVPGRAEAFELPHAAPMADLRDSVLAAGSLTVCSQCALRRGLTESDLVEGTRIAGSASFVDEVLAPDAQALVY